MITVRRQKAQVSRPRHNLCPLRSWEANNTRHGLQRSPFRPTSVEHPPFRSHHLALIYRQFARLLRHQRPPCYRPHTHIVHPDSVQMAQRGHTTTRRMPLPFHSIGSSHHVELAFPAGLLRHPAWRPPARLQSRRHLWRPPTGTSSLCRVISPYSPSRWWLAWRHGNRDRCGAPAPPVDAPPMACICRKHSTLLHWCCQLTCSLSNNLLFFSCCIVCCRQCSFEPRLLIQRSIPWIHITLFYFHRKLVAHLTTC